jgi:hypothetical protein
MRDRNLLIFGVLTLFGAAMAMGYFWIFTAIGPSTVHGFVRFPTEPPWRLELRQEIAFVRSRSVLKSALKKDGIRDFAIVKKQRNPIEWLERALVVDVSDDGNVICISLTGHDSQELAAIVNAVLDAYDEGLVAKEKSEAEHEVHRLAGALRRDAMIERFEIERAHGDFHRGLIPLARTTDRESANRVKVETFQRRDVSIQRAKRQ